MGNWRYIKINGRLPTGVDSLEVSDFLNQHQDIDYFQDVAGGVHGLHYWISDSVNGEISMECTIGKCPGDLDFVGEEMQILADQYFDLELIIDIGQAYECRICEASFVVSQGKVVKEEARINKMGYRKSCECDKCI